MYQILNPSVAGLTKALLELLHENGYAQSAVERNMRYAKQLSDFMLRNELQSYDELVGAKFQEELCQWYSVETQLNIKLFVARINAIRQGEGLLIYRKRSDPIILPDGLDNLLTCYTKHCSSKGLAFRTIQDYERRCRIFLKLLADDGISDSNKITAASVSKAYLQLPSSHDFPVIQRFLCFLAEEEYINQNSRSLFHALSNLNQFLQSIVQKRCNPLR